MRTLQRISALLDRTSAAVGSAVSWLALAMVLIGAFNAVVRYLARFGGPSLSSNAYIELQWYLFSALFLLAAANTLREGGHVRVDVLYGRLGVRGRAWIDFVGTLLLLLPFCVFALWMSWPAVESSWAIREQSPDPGGLPRYPIKSLILLSFALLILQGLSQAIKHGLTAFGRPTSPDDGAPGGGERS